MIPYQSAMLTLKIVKGKTYQQAANEMGISRQWAHTLVARVFDQLYPDWRNKRVWLPDHYSDIEHAMKVTLAYYAGKSSASSKYKEKKAKWDKWRSEVSSSG